MRVDGVYEHINNGGVSFKVTDEHGPTIEIEASHFGNTTNKIKLHVTKQSLENLAQLFHEAAQIEYGDTYVCATETMWIDKTTGKVYGNEMEEQCGNVHGEQEKPS